jgi:hypothetical protein
MTAAARFIEGKHYYVTPSGCWEWLWCRGPDGYGQYGTTIRKAHRIAYTDAKGPVPRGLDVCHSCDNRACINPSHLWVGTRKENMQDAVRKNRVRRGENVASAKLNARQVSVIRSAARFGVPQRFLAGCFGVCQATIWQVISGHTWRDRYAC